MGKATECQCNAIIIKALGYVAKACPEHPLCGRISQCYPQLEIFSQQKLFGITHPLGVFSLPGG